MDKAVVITVGSELVEGLRLDTNGPEIARRLGRLGFQVDETISVADDLEALSGVFRLLCSHYQLVVSTGGLGPTHDDVTRDAAAEALGLGMHPDPEMDRRLMSIASKSARTEQIRTDLKRMALRIEGATLIMPTRGTAPGQLVETPAGRLLLLPGPPDECMQVFESFTADLLVEEPPQTIDISIFGILESEVQHLVAPLLPPTVEFTVLANPSEVHAILTDRGSAPGEFEEARDAVIDALGTCVFSTKSQTLAEVVLELARERGLKLATAESCTGGMIASALTDVPGSSDVFNGGIVSYSNEVKASVLGVSRDDLEVLGAVSSEVAEQMVHGVLAALDADIAVSVTGVAGPGGGSPEKPVGTVWFGVGDASGIDTVLRHRGGTREAIRLRSRSTALDLMRRRMLGLPLDNEFDLEV